MPLSATIGTEAGLGQAAMDYTAIFIMACIFIPLERLTALYPEQGALRRNWMSDVLYVLFNGFFIRAGFTFIAGLSMYAYKVAFGAAPSAWVAEYPLWVQVIGCIVIADIGYYTAHRISHSVPFLWKFHAVHHSIEEMDWLAAHRIHPVDMLFTHSFALLPLYFMGFSLEAVVIFQVIYQAHTLLIHANTRLRFGPLKWLIASPEYHHWHHANEPEAYDRNFAAQLSVIDWIAGTLFLPLRRPARYGINEEMPRWYHQQLLHPFRSLGRAARREPPPLERTPHEQDA
jgi:sterol desaturase/sphingolipid hydroxylase (fatty acid hydroxylase superfamily)